MWDIKMDTSQELRPACNISPSKKCSSTDASSYQQYLEAKSRQNAMKRQQEELERQSARALREQGWAKYVNGENKAVTRKAVPSIPGPRAAPSKKGPGNQTQHHHHTMNKTGYSAPGIPVMPMSGPPPRSAVPSGGGAAGAKLTSPYKRVQEAQRRKSDREKWEYVGIDPQPRESIEESLKPGCLEIAKVPPQQPEYNEQEMTLFEGIGTIFDEFTATYDFNGQGSGLEDPAIEGHVKEALMRQTCAFADADVEYNAGAQDGSGEMGTISILGGTTSTSKRESSYPWSGSLSSIPSEPNVSISMNIPDSLMILAEKMDQLPPSCFHSQEQLPVHEELPARAHSEPSIQHNDNIRPRSSAEELRQQAQDIRVALTKVSNADPKDLADYVLNMPQDFQVKLINLLRKGMSGDPTSLGELHISFQQGSMISEAGDATILSGRRNSVSIVSTPVREVRRVKEVHDSGTQMQDTYNLPVNTHQNLPRFGPGLNLDPEESPAVPESLQHDQLPKQPFQPTPTPTFSRGMRESGLSDPTSPEDRPITSANQHSLQRPTLRHPTVSPPDCNAPDVDILVAAGALEEIGQENLVDSALQEHFDNYAHRHTRPNDKSHRELCTSGSTSSLGVNDDDDDGSSDSENISPITPQNEVNRILRMEEALKEAHTNRRMSAKALLSASRRNSSVSDTKLPSVLNSPLIHHAMARQSRPQSQHAPRTPRHNAATPQAVSASGGSSTATYGPTYLNRVQRTEEGLPILILKFVSAHPAVSASSIRTTMLPNILQMGQNVIYTAEYLSIRTSTWKKQQRQSVMFIADAIPSQKEPIYILLSGMYLPGTPQYSISQETRRAREPAFIPRDFVAHLYKCYLSAAENYCKQHFQAHSYEKTVKELKALLPCGVSVGPVNASALRKHVLDLSSIIARDPEFRAASCIETHRCTDAMAATSLSSTTDTVVNLVPYSPSDADPNTRFGASESLGRSVTQSRSLRPSSCLRSTASTDKSDRITLYDKVTIEVLSNHGDTSFVGLSALQFYDPEGTEIYPFYDAISGPDAATTPATISKDAKTSSIIPPGSIYNLLNYECRTTDPDKMWLMRRALAKTIVITVSIPIARRVSAIRFWNYNRSPATTDKGVRRALVKLNGATVADAEIKKAPGTLSGCCLATTLIMFDPKNREYMAKLLARDRYRDIIADDSHSLKQINKLGEISVSQSGGAHGQKSVSSSSCCFLGPLSTGTISIIVTSMYGDDARSVSLGNIILIDHNNTALLPRKVQIHGTDAQHVIRGHCLNEGEKVVSFIPELTLEQSCYTGMADKENARRMRESHGERLVADAPDEPLWLCSLEKGRRDRRSSDSGADSGESDGTDVVERRRQSVLATEAGLGLTIWFKAGGTVSEDGLIVSQGRGSPEASKGLCDNEAGTEEAEQAFYIKNIIILNTAGDVSSNVKHVLVFVGDRLWTPFPGAFVRPNCYMNYFASCSMHLKSLLNKVSLATKARHMRSDAENKAQGLFEYLYKNVTADAIKDTPAFIEPKITTFAKNMHMNVLFGQWITLGPTPPKSAADINKAAGSHGDNDALLTAVYRELLGRADGIHELRARMGYGVGRYLEPISPGNSMYTQGQLVYVSQRLANAESHLSYASLNTPRGYTLTINILSRYGSQNRPRSTSQRASKDVPASACLPGGNFSTKFSLGFSSVIICDGAHTPLDFNRAGWGVYSTFMGEILAYDLRIYKDVDASIVVSDAKNSAGNLLKGLPWAAEYEVTLRAGRNASVDNWSEDLLRKLGTSRSDGALTSIHFVSASSMEVGSIVLSNNKAAEISVSLDSVLIFEGRLKNTPDPQVITLCKDQKYSRSLTSVDISSA